MIEATAPKYRRFQFGGSKQKHFGYDAVSASSRRRMAAPILRSEDWELQPFARKQLAASQRDIGRNFSVARWMIERHLDYVTSFTFKFRSADDTLNRLVEARMKTWFNRRNSDVAARHNFASCIRLAEASALTANDCLAIKLADGRIQWIEGDRLANPGNGLPPDIDARALVHGVLVDDYTATKKYIVCRRGPKGNAWQAPTVLTFDQTIDAEDAFLHGFFDRFDQIRGVSPLACALNSLQDLYEAKTYALGRMKIDQLWALAVYRGDTSAITERATDAAGTPLGQDYLKMPIGNGPIIADLDVGDRMEAIQSAQPSSQFQDFMQKAISFTLKALAIPYSFFDEAYTNYSGARQALLQYEQAADLRRDVIREMLDELTTWRLNLFILDDELPQIDPKDFQWEWVAASLPWIDPLKEAQANIALIGANLESEIHVLKQQGRDFADVLNERKRAQQMIKDAGLSQAMKADPALTAAILAQDQKQ